jgi:hypothetical protein
MSSIVVLLSAEVVAQSANENSLNSVCHLHKSNVGGVCAVNGAQILVGTAEYALTVYKPHIFVTLLARVTESIYYDLAAHDAVVDIVIKIRL